MGNRGCLHEGTEVVRHHRGRRWIVCETDFRGRWTRQWAPGRYTVLFFHDEAVALAAGHRPCAQCRWAAYRDFLAACGHRGSVDVLDERLHVERLTDGGHAAGWVDVPDGAFVRSDDGVPLLVDGDRLVPWSPSGYDPASARPRPSSGRASLLTPPTTCAAIRAGYRPQVDDSAS